MPRATTPAMRLRNKIGSLTIANAPQEEIEEVRRELAVLKLEPQIQEALSHGVKPGTIGYIAKKLAGAK